jgi:Domain of unknown function (DUF4263)
MILKNKLTEALEEAKGEREIHAFLKQEPLLVWETFKACGGHSNYVIPEFSLSGKYYADFVVMQSFSGGWNIAFIELEPVDEKPFNGKGIPSARLRGAMKQINDWRDFEKEQGAALRSHLADAAQRRDTLYPEHNLAREPWCVRMPLRDPKTYLCCKYFIVMGRRSHFDEELINTKATFVRHHNIELLTYDRFTTVAENLTQQYEYYTNRTIEKEEKIFLDQFAENPEQFIVPGNQDLSRYPSEMDIYGTRYNIRSNEAGDGFVVNVLDGVYEIYEDRRTFNVSRIDPDGLGCNIAINLESLSAAIQLAEIHERCIYFHVYTKHSLDLVNERLQILRKNPPLRIEPD